KKMSISPILQFDISENDSIIDLFSGLGNITLPISQHAKTVIGVEGEPTMVKRSKETADNNKITNVNFYAANLFESFEDKEWFN
ncbi:methyltransferase domain-containing protein, partial [Francisella tularensis subsp. holarctica]|uniref:methyltransferase domain-containing protein n=1 Tax=Francisella tularensis TaxID=263 RepID=UPI002381BB74